MRRFVYTALEVAAAPLCVAAFLALLAALLAGAALRLCRVGPGPEEGDL